MTSELEDFRASVRRFFETEVAPQREKWESQQFVDREIWRKAGKLGMLCVNVPQEWGGVGGNFLHEAVIIEEQARVGDTSFGVVLANMGVPIFLHSATAEQKLRWIPPLTTGESIFAFALSEPDAGSDAKAIRTTARRENDYYVINGVKTFISNGHNGDTVLLAARTPGTLGADGVSLFILDTGGLEGFRVGRILKKVGQKGQDTAELFLDEVRVHKSQLVGEIEGKGFAQLMNGLRTERIVLGLIGVAQAERAIEITLAHVKQRRAFGGSLFDLQNTRFKIAECITRTKISRIFIDHCISLALEDRVDSATAAMAKWWCTELQNTVIDECVQLHGGYGYLNEYPIARMWADARIQRIYGGANEIQKEVIARSL